MDESEIQTAMKLKVATQLLADSERKNEELNAQVDKKLLDFSIFLFRYFCRK